MDYKASLQMSINDLSRYNDHDLAVMYRHFDVRDIRGLAVKILSLSGAVQRAPMPLFDMPERERNMIIAKIGQPRGWQNLTHIILSNQGLTSLPDELWTLTNLRDLQVIGNQLRSLSESIGNLTNLRILYVNHNKLTELPESIGNLTNLQDLNVRNNKLSSLPESIGNLANLRKLDVDYNKLSSLPESIGNLTNLQDLYVRNNKLSSLPESIGNLSNLRKLDVDRNQLTELPESIGNLSNLQNLLVYDNQLSSLPESIGNLSNLRILNIIANGLTELPESIGNLSNLRYLSLFQNLVISVSQQTLNFLLQIPHRDYNENFFQVVQGQQSSAVSLLIDANSVRYQELLNEQPNEQVALFALATELREQEIVDQIRTNALRTQDRPTMLGIMRYQAAGEATRAQAAIVAQEARVVDIPQQAAQCDNETDFITTDEWDAENLPQVVIRFWQQPQPGQEWGGTTFTQCFTIDSLRYWFDIRHPDSNHYYQNDATVWLPIRFGLPLDDDGRVPLDYPGEIRGTKPSRNTVFKRLPGGNIFVLGADLLLDGGDFYGIPIATNLRLGNMLGSIGVSELHGQTPGKTVYLIVPSDANVPNVLEEHLQALADARVLQGIILDGERPTIDEKINAIQELYDQYPAVDADYPDLGEGDFVAPTEENLEAVVIADDDYSDSDEGEPPDLVEGPPDLVNISNMYRAMIDSFGARGDVSALFLRESPDDYWRYDDIYLDINELRDERGLQPNSEVYHLYPPLDETLTAFVPGPPTERDLELLRLRPAHDDIVFMMHMRNVPF